MIESTSKRRDEVRKKSKAQKYLERVEWIDSIVHNNLIEQKQWQELALSITANMGGERVQSSGSKSKMADAVEHCVDAEDYILRSVQRLKAEKREIVSTIEQVDSPTFYNVLFKKYVQYKSLQEIADEYKRSYEWIKSTHGRAVANVQRILDAKK